MQRRGWRRERSKNKLHIDNWVSEPYVTSGFSRRADFQVTFLEPAQPKQEGGPKINNLAHHIQLSSAAYTIDYYLNNIAVHMFQLLKYTKGFYQMCAVRISHLAAIFPTHCIDSGRR